MPVVYLRQHRLADVGLLFFGAGMAAVLTLGPTLLQTPTNLAIQVGSDTWAFFAGAAVLTAIGFAVIAVAARRQPTGR